MTHYIGIDPDLIKSGVAVYRNKSLESLSLMYLWEVFAYIKEHNPIVVLEAGHTVKKFWHGGAGKGTQAAKNVGANNAIGQLIEQYCTVNGHKVILVKPQGYSRIKHEQFVKITGWKTRTNPETRVAALLVWGR